MDRDKNEYVYGEYAFQVSFNNCPYKIPPFQIVQRPDGFWQMPKRISFTKMTETKEGTTIQLNRALLHPFQSQFHS